MSLLAPPEPKPRVTTPLKMGLFTLNSQFSFDSDKCPTHHRHITDSPVTLTGIIERDHRLFAGRDLVVTMPGGREYPVLMSVYASLDFAQLQLDIYSPRRDFADICALAVRELDDNYHLTVMLTPQRIFDGNRPLKDYDFREMGNGKLQLSPQFKPPFYARKMFPYIHIL